MIDLGFNPFLPTAREGNVFACLCHSVHKRPHAYSVTTHPCWPLSHMLRCGWYASYWNAFLLLPAMQLWQGNVFTPVCHSVHSGGGGSLSGRPPRQRTPRQRTPWAETPLDIKAPGQRPPRQRPPQTENPPGRKAPGQRPPGQRTLRTENPPDR